MSIIRILSIRPYGQTFTNGGFYMVYKTQGTCSREIHFDVENNKLKNVSFVGGCNGNLKGIGLLVEGMDIDDVIKSRRRKLQRPPNLMSRPACKSFKAVQRAAGLNIKSESFPDVKIAPQEVCCARGYFFYSVHKLSNHYSHRPRPVLSTVSSHQPSPFISLYLYYSAEIIY